MNITKPNDAWVLHREEVYTIQDGYCNVYLLLDAHSTFCFGQVLSVDLPPTVDMIHLLKKARRKTDGWPRQILIVKDDPYIMTLSVITEDFNIKTTVLPYKDLKKFVHALSESFNKFKSGTLRHPEPKPEQESLRELIPKTYSFCPCASGKKFKFCCQKIFHEITFAMCAAEKGDLEEALRFMKKAELIAGVTAEILCRYAIFWSFYDQKKMLKYLKQAIQKDPNHPRANYILGIEAVSNKNYTAAIQYYQNAILHYPKEDKFHLNETYNNLGTAFYRLDQYQEAKAVWEKALILLPSDQMVRNNLFECIYENPMVPEYIREISPFVKKYLATPSVN